MTLTTTGIALWSLAIGLLIYGLLRKGGNHEQLEDKQPSQPEVIELRDPVCGMEVKKNSTSLVSDHFGRTFHFCSEQCRKLFDINPNKYVGSS